MSFFGSRESAEKYRFTIDSNARLESISTLNNALNSCPIILSNSMCVLLVQCIRGFAQIRESIVIMNSIDVIDLVTRPRAGHPRPREPMRSIAATVNFDLPVFVIAETSGSGPDLAPIAATGTPSEDPGLGIVCEQFADALNGYNTVSHDATAFADWLEPASRVKRVSARLF